MTNFLSCDWGTTNFRLRLINADDLSIISELSNDRGISSVHNDWKNSGTAREEFYASHLQEASRQLAQSAGATLAGLPMLISGMASSTLGIRELPYGLLPFDDHGIGAVAEQISIRGLDHEITLISGLKTSDDVMRGEETQWLGLMNDPLLEDVTDLLLILPGTHSKHIQVQQRRMVDFKTFMTGEFFNLLTQHSVLKNSVLPGSVIADGDDEAAFVAGVRASSRNALLHESFLVRTNDLFKKFPQKQNTFYLSGLLIGTELQNTGELRIAVAAGNSLLKIYQLALETLGHTGKLIIFSTQSLDLALIKGQLIIFNQNNRTR